MMKIKEHNTETGEIIERDMTEAEADQYAKDQAEKAAQLADIEAKTVAKNALLTKLGITADEAALLLA